MRAAIADIFHKNFFIGFIYGTLAVERIHVAVKTGAGTQPRAGTKKNGGSGIGGTKSGSKTGKTAADYKNVVCSGTDLKWNLLLHEKYPPEDLFFVVFAIEMILHGVVESIAVPGPQCFVYMYMFINGDTQIFMGSFDFIISVSYTHLTLPTN